MRIEPDPSQVQVVGIAVAQDAGSDVGPFWAAALGYRSLGPKEDVVDRHRRNPYVSFQQLKPPRPGRGRTHIDVSVPEKVQTLQRMMQGKPVDILINNAGIFKNESLDDMNFSTIEEQLAVNAVAPLRVTHALLGNLRAGSKIGLVTSRMGSIGDNGSGAYYGYRMSKAALNAAGKSLAVDLKPRDISVAILHPGMVSTRMIGFSGNVSPEEAAQGLAARIDGLTMDNSGTFWHANGEVLPW